MERLNREIDRGRVRYLGASNWSVQRLASANEYAAREGLQGFVASQVQWSLAQPNWRPTADPTTRFVTDEEIAWHSASGVPLMTYSATAGGYFADSGKLSEFYDNSLNRARRERAAILSAQLGCTPTQVALAYLLHQTPHVVPIFGTTNRAHLAEALGAVTVSLTPEQVEWLAGGQEFMRETVE